MAKAALQRFTAVDALRFAVKHGVDLFVYLTALRLQQASMQVATRRSVLPGLVSTEESQHAAIASFSSAFSSFKQYQTIQLLNQAVLQPSEMQLLR